MPKKLLLLLLLLLLALAALAPAGTTAVVPRQTSSQASPPAPQPQPPEPTPEAPQPEPPDQVRPVVGGTPGTDRARGPDFLTMESVILPDNRVQITNTTAYPWRFIVNLEIDFTGAPFNRDTWC